MSIHAKWPPDWWSHHLSLARRALRVAQSPLRGLQQVMGWHHQWDNRNLELPVTDRRTTPLSRTHFTTSVRSGLRAGGLRPEPTAQNPQPERPEVFLIGALRIERWVTHALRTSHRISWRRSLRTLILAILPPLLASTELYAGQQHTTNAEPQAVLSNDGPKSGALKPSASTARKAKSPAGGAEKTAPGNMLVSKEAAPVSGEQVEMVARSIHGEVGAKNSAGMAIVYEKDPSKGSEKEIWLSFGPGLAVSGVKTLAELEMGDTVIALYDEASDGSKRVLRRLTLLQKHPAAKSRSLSPSAAGLSSQTSQ